MPKMKTNRAAAKRFSITAGGKVKVKRAFGRHILTKKNRKRKRRLRDAHYLSSADVGRVRRMMPYSG